MKCEISGNYHGSFERRVISREPANNRVRCTPPPRRNVDSTLARILRFVIKGYCYSPSRFLSSSRGKRNFRWLEKEIPRFFSLFFSLTDCSFHSITIKLPYRETFPELKKRFSFPERERERFVSQIK